MSERHRSLVYGYALYPIHQVIFAGMIRKITGRAGLLEATTRPASAVGGESAAGSPS